MKICEITGKTAQVGNNVSHSNKKTKRRFNPNLKTKRFWNEEEGRWITLKVTAAGMKTINKKGLSRSPEKRRCAQIGLLIINRSRKWQKKVTGFRLSLSARNRKRAGFRECQGISLTKNKKNHARQDGGRKKYNPILKRVTIHREIK